MDSSRKGNYYSPMLIFYLIEQKKQGAKLTQTRSIGMLSPLENPRNGSQKTENEKSASKVALCRSPNVLLRTDTCGSIPSESENRLDCEGTGLQISNTIHKRPRMKKTLKTNHSFVAKTDLTTESYCEPQDDALNRECVVSAKACVLS